MIDRRRYPGIMALGGTLVLLWGSVFERFFGLRVPYYIPLALLCYAGSALSLSRRFIRRPDLVFFGVSLVAIIHHLYLLELNDYRPYFMISSMLAISLATLVSSRLTHIVAMVSVPVIYLAWACLYRPTESRVLVFMGVASISAVIYYVAFEREAWIRRSQSDQHTIEMHRARSIETAKMAALGEMAGGIAHEVNNPLAIIAGKAEQLAREVRSGRASPDELVQGLDSIQRTVQRIVKIVRGLRSFARDVEQDPMELVTLNSLIEETLNFCSARLQNDQIQLTIERAPENLLVSCRSTQISQVLLNLLINARDAIEGQKDKWIRVQAGVEGEFAIIRVTDSGNGLPDAIREKIFQPFFTTKPIGKGTGLGLSVCKGILDAHHGFIRIGAQTANTEFVVGLPLRAMQAA